VAEDPLPQELLLAKEHQELLQQHQAGAEDHLLQQLQQQLQLAEEQEREHHKDHLKLVELAL
jgi:hypothetical protein